MGYPRERKEAVLKKMLPPNNQTISEISKEGGICEGTLYNWRKAARGRPADAGWRHHASGVVCNRQVCGGCRDGLNDGRPDAEHQEPANKLTPEERQQILKTCNEAAYQSLPPSQIVPALADKATCIASESSFYRVLKEADQPHHRGKNQAPRKVAKPEACKAAGPNEVWSWDMTFLATTITDLFYRIYLVMDIYSRKIVGWEIHENETAENTSLLIRKACLAEGVSKKGLVLW